MARACAIAVVALLCTSGVADDAGSASPPDTARDDGDRRSVAALLNVVPFGVGSFWMGDQRGGALVVVTDAIALSLFLVGGEPANSVAWGLFSASRAHAIARPLMLRDVPPESFARTLAPRTFTASLLNFVPGFGLGSFVAGDARDGAVLLGADVLAAGLIAGGIALWGGKTAGSEPSGPELIGAFMAGGGIGLAIVSRTAGLAVPWLREVATVRVAPTLGAASGIRGSWAPGIVVSLGAGGRE